MRRELIKQTEANDVAELKMLKQVLAQVRTVASAVNEAKTRAIAQTQLVELQTIIKGSWHASAPFLPMRPSHAVVVGCQAWTSPS